MSRSLSSTATTPTPARPRLMQLTLAMPTTTAAPPPRSLSRSTRLVHQPRSTAQRTLPTTARRRLHVRRLRQAPVDLNVSVTSSTATTPTPARLRLMRLTLVMPTTTAAPPRRLLSPSTRLVHLPRSTARRMSPTMARRRLHVRRLRQAQVVSTSR